MPRVNEISDIANVQPIRIAGPRQPDIPPYPEPTDQRPPSGGILIFSDGTFSIGQNIRIKLR